MMVLSLRTRYSFIPSRGWAGVPTYGARNGCSSLKASAGIRFVVPWGRPFAVLASQRTADSFNISMLVNSLPRRKLYLMYLTTFSTLPFDCGSLFRQNTHWKCSEDTNA
ncbi:MAG: hypothetical protein GX125_05530 [Bacteroidales bacterium]|nr:hypothetical protein [Bacteroidales bacterium]